MKKKDYRYALCFLAVVICLALIFPVDPFTNSMISPESTPVELDLGEQQYQTSEAPRNVLGGRETAFYGMADNDSVRSLVGYADYLVVSHALYSDGETIRDNVRYLSDNGVKIILVCGWFDVWPFTGAGINDWDKMHYEDVVYGMNATEAVKYRIRNCMDTIGSEYIWGISIGEEEPGASTFPQPLIAWYMNLFYDWIHEEYPGVKAVQWPSPHTYATNPSNGLKADAIIYDNYNQNYTSIAEIGGEIKAAYPDAPLIYIISAAEHIDPWFTCHPATYTKQAVEAIAQYADVIGFWVTDDAGIEGWENNHPGHQLALRLCNEIHLMDWNTIHGTTEWFECGFGNDSMTEALDNWYTSYWYTETPDPSLSVSLASDYAVGSNAINLTCTTAGTHSYWWQKLGHDYGFQDQMGFPYAPINMTDASRITFWVKGIGWDNHPEADVTMYIEKSNYPIGFAGNLTLPDFTSLLSDGAWHQVQVALPDGASYYNWDGYASQIHFVVDYLTDVGGDTTTILFDGFVVESFDTGKAKGLATTSDFVWADNGTLEVGGNAFFESNFTQTNSWFYRYSGTGNVEMYINGTWTTPPDQGVPCYWNVSGYRLYNGTYDWIEFHCIPPFVEIVNPEEGDKLSGIVDVHVNATDDAGIDEVKFYLDGILEHTDDTFPYSWTWNTQIIVDGSHELNVTALSIDANLNFHYISVTVDNTDPAVAITNPSNNSNVKESVSIAAVASDVSGIEQIEFYVDGALYFTDFSSPYEYIWDTTTEFDGLKNLTCLAKDGAGNTNTDIVYAMVDNSGPLISIHSLSVWGDSGQIGVNTSDASGIDRVAFYFEGALQEVDYFYPYEWVWSGLLLPDGNYTIMATSYDTLNHSSTVSSEVEIDNTLPSLSISWTPPGTSLSGVVSFSAVTTDSNGIAYVEFYLDGVLQYTDYSSPYSWVWDTTLSLDGNHTLEVISFDNMANFKEIVVILNVDNTEPSIFVNSPANHTILSGPSAISVVVTVQDTSVIDTVLLSYNTGSSWTSIEMIPSGSYFEGTTPVFPHGTDVLFRVFANDTFGNSVWTLVYECQVFDQTGPIIGIPTLFPIAPTSFDTVTVSATITDHAGVDAAILSYRVDSGSWTNISLSFNSLYWANIPAMVTGSNVSYRVYANDTLNHWTSTPIYEYTVVPFDVLPPDILETNWTPLIPDVSQNIDVVVNATDQSGVVDMILSYHDGLSWHNISMVFSSGLYTAQIPPQSYGADVTMKVYASDGQGNWGITPIGSFSVVSDDLEGPVLELLSWSPSIPTEEDDVEVYVEISDTNVIRTTILCYGHGTMFANTTMKFNGTGYVVMIGAHPTGYQMDLCIFSCDSRDNWAVSDWFMYIVQASDVTGPVISDVEWLPSAPLSNETIRVDVIVSDENPISRVLLGYFDGVHWRNLTMDPMSSNQYVAHIPAIGTAGTIQIWILAQDSKGNWGYTDYMDIEVSPEPIPTIPTTPSTTTTPPITSTTPTGTVPPDATMILLIGGSGWVAVVIILVFFVRTRKK